MTGLEAHTPGEPDGLRKRKKPDHWDLPDVDGTILCRNVLDAVVHENILSHAHHEVTPIVNRERNETEIHQKVQPVV